MVFVACAQVHAGAPDDPATPVAAVASAEDDPAFPKPAADGDRYILGPGDVIQVFVWRDQELSTTMPVLPDGTISTPLVDGIMASGKTPVQLARAVEAALSEYVRSPRVSVLVSTPKGSNRQVKIVGQGIKPTSVPYEEGMKVMDAILAAGGLTTFAAGNRAKLIRMVGDKQQETPLKLKNLMEKGDMKQNLPLQAGDILMVPESRF